MCAILSNVCVTYYRQKQNKINKMKYSSNENHFREKIINTSEENNKQLPSKKAFQLTRTKSLNSAH